MKWCCVGERGELATNIKEITARQHDFLETEGAFDHEIRAAPAWHLHAFRAPTKPPAAVHVAPTYHTSHAMSNALRQGYHASADTQRHLNLMRPATASAQSASEELVDILRNGFPPGLTEDMEDEMLGRILDELGAQEFQATLEGRDGHLANQGEEKDEEEEEEESTLQSDDESDLPVEQLYNEKVFHSASTNIPEPRAASTSTLHTSHHSSRARISDNTTSNHVFRLRVLFEIVPANMDITVHLIARQ